MSPITTFPYLEDFENAPAWTVGGVAPDWAWGAPAHPLINTAGGGVNSWCVGGLTGAFYNFGQMSWLESPCFDLSGMDHPWIGFQVFWEVERQFDGLGLQVSTDGGLTWANVGAWGDPVDCLNDNWFNTGNINNLTLATPRHGWSGRVGPTQGSCAGGFGSGQWVEAKHCVPAAANEAQVKFRFLFGAGTTCNSYDGIAIDDFLLQEAPSTDADFTFTCNGLTVDFARQATPCPTGFSWDFGDPGSGAQNTSTQQNPGHTYPGPGTYNVTLTVNGPCSDPGTLTIPVTILEVSATATDALCSGGTGSALALATGTSAPVQFDWQPGGLTGDSVGNLAPGTYTVTASVPDGCPAQATVTVNEPQPVVLQAMNDTTVCPGTTLDLTASASGGAGGFQYGWNPAGPQLAPAQPGTYTVTATDANGCTSAPTSVIVALHPEVVPVFTVDEPEGCADHCVQLADQTAGAVVWEWTLGDGSTSGTNAPQHCYAAGTFDISLTVTDANGCAGTTTEVAFINALPTPVAAFSFTPLVATIADPLFSFQDGSQGATSWNWSFGDPAGCGSQGPAPGFAYGDVGCYPVMLEVANDAGCSDATSTEVCVEGEYALYAPNAFTPDGDGYNDVWLPVTSVVVPRAWELLVFDRWGRAVFTGTRPGEGWDGESYPVGVYVWKLRVQDGLGTVREHRGHVSLLR